MNLQNKTDKGGNKQSLSDLQKGQIGPAEPYLDKPFRLLAALWLGVFIFCLGVLSLISEYRERLPKEIQGIGWFFLILCGLIGIYFGIKNHYRFLRESALFFTFLMIGIGLGLLAQIFDLPFSGKLLLLWAGLSFALVLFSEHTLLSLLWLPLFVGGILGYIRLEFLLLFLNQAPIATVILAAVLFGGLIYLTEKSRYPFIQALHTWALILFFGVLLVGEAGISNSFVSCCITLFFLAVLAFYAAARQKVRLFNITLLFIAVRFIVLSCDLFRMDAAVGEWLTAIGLMLVISIGGWLFINQRVNKR